MSSTTNEPARRKKGLRWAHLARALADVLVLACVFVLAHLVRFDGTLPETALRRLLTTLPFVVALQTLTLRVMGVHRFSWRYLGIRELSPILHSLTYAAVVLGGARVAVGQFQGQYPWLSDAMVPFGVIAIDFVFAFCGIIGIRLIRRMTAETPVKARGDGAPTLLVGAGRGGLLVAREIESNPKLAMRAVGFLDDDPAKLGTVINGVRVVGTSTEVADWVRQTGATQVLITMTNVRGSTVREILRSAEKAGVDTKMVPGLQELVGGDLQLNRIREVNIDDLLRREPIQLDGGSMRALIEGQVLMVTGAGGSIGSELCRQVCRLGPARLLLVERAEPALFEIEQELLATYPGLEIETCVGDVTDPDRMRQLLRNTRPSTILHAAAHKHVPLMERAPGEAIKNNVGGTANLALLADEFGVERFVLISTDKAVHPSSVMGASKRAAEMFLKTLASSSTRFMAVRFGNVLGSAGSVVPIFKRQIAAGGPVRVTDPGMQRYFMTIPEACQLVLQAAALGERDAVFVLDMGEPVRIVDLAEDLIRLSGLTPGEDIEIQFTGRRPGEKLFEELVLDSENAERTMHEKIFVGREPLADPQQVRDRLAALLEVARSGAEHHRVIAMLRSVVVDFVPPGERDDSTPPVAAAAPREILPSGPFTRPSFASGGGG